MNVLDQYMRPQAEALSLRQKRLEILSSNIANAGTPNFKARDIDFAAEYKNAVGSGELATTNVQHISMLQASPAGSARYRVPVSPSLDGNTVELHVEQLQFSQNTTAYEADLQFLSERIKSLRSALRGE